MATNPSPERLPSDYKTLDPEVQLTGVIPTSSIKLRFDRFLLPSSTFRQSICVQGDTTKEVKSSKDCTSGVFFEPTYDPIHREVTYWQSQDLEREHLQENTPYKITVIKPSSAASGGIQAFDGAPLDDVYTFLFETTVTPPIAEIDRVSVADVFCSPPAADANPVRDSLRSCSYGLCHRQDDAANPPLPPAEGLDMSNAERIGLTAIGDTAHETQTGEHARSPDANSLRFGKAMPIIDPGFPGNSYLVYKVLANPANYRSIADPPDEDEIARLRAGIVVGMPMPPSNAVGMPGAPRAEFKDAASLDALSTWILQGAPTACP